MRRRGTEDYAAFDTLVDRHWRKVASIATHFLTDPNDVEDILQDTFVGAFANLGRFRCEAGIQTWLIRIAINLCKNRRQSFWKRKVFLLQDSAYEPPPQIHNESETALLVGEQTRTLHHAVQQLPEKNRLPIVLHYFEGLTGAEIASVLGWSEGVVWSRLYAGCRDLKKRLAAWQETE